MEDYVKAFDPPEIARLYTANGSLPVYETEYKGEKIALFVSRVGAPACVAGLEEIIAMGAQKIVLFGCCGILNENATKGKIILPVSAIRDEGTSQYYLPPEDEIETDKNCLKAAEDFYRDLRSPMSWARFGQATLFTGKRPPLSQKKRTGVFGCGNGMRCFYGGRAIQEHTFYSVFVWGR